MKALTLIYFSFMSFSLLLGQSPSDQGENKKFMNSIHRFKTGHLEQLDECALSGARIIGPSIIYNVFPNYMFTILREDSSNGGFIIEFLKWKDDPILNSTFGTSGIGVSGTPNPRRYFWLPYAIYNSSCELLVSKWNFTFGMTNIPFKLRFGSGSNDTLDNGQQKRFFDFTSDVNVGVSAGVQFRPKRDGYFSLSLTTGIAITGIHLDSSNTKGFAKSPSTASAFTPYTALIFDFSEFQFGVFYGIDYVPGQIGRKWDYRDHPWLGVGIGYSLFQSETSKRKKQVK